MSRRNEVDVGSAAAEEEEADAEGVYKTDEGGSDHDQDRDSDEAEDSSGESEEEESSDEGQDRESAKRSDSMGSASSSAKEKPQGFAILKPRPMFDDGTEEQEFTQEVQTGTGWKLQWPGPHHVLKCPEKEPLGVRLQDVLPNGLKDNSKFEDELRTGESKVNFSDPFKPYYTLQGEDDLTLQFESRFESGNLAQAVKVGEREYDLEMSKDFNTGGHTQWFYFGVRNMRAGMPYKLNITNFYKTNSLYNAGLRPLLYSEHRASAQDGVGWFRTGERICYYKSSRKRKEGKPKISKKAPGPGTLEEPKKVTRDKFWYCLTVTITFPYDTDSCFIAHSYPLTFSDTRRHIAALLSRNKETLRRRVLCQTLAGNNCEVLTITNSNGAGRVAMHYDASDRN